MLSGRNLCDELITRPEESYRLCYVVVCDLETSRIGAPYIYEISNLRVKTIVCFLVGNYPASEFLCRRFGTLCLFNLHRRISMKDD